MFRRSVLALGIAALAAPSIAQQATTEEAPELPEVAEIAIGAEDAPVTLVEYASFTCPHCARFHAEVYPTIMRDYVETGQVRFVYREVFFDRPGLWAAMLARCAGEDRYLPMASMIYEAQDQWARGEPAEIAQNLMRLGRTAGMEQETIDACFSDGAMAQAMVANYEANVEADDIRATPSLILDGEKLPNLALPDLREKLDAALAG